MFHINITTLFIVIGIFWFVRLVRALLFNVYLWQLKEYRLDRLLAHFKIPKSRKIFFNPIIFLKLIVLLIFVIYKISNISDIHVWLRILAITLIPLIYLIEFLITTKHIIKKTLIKPIFTYKALLILFLGLITCFSFFFYLDKNILSFIMIDLFVFAIITLIVFIINPISNIFKKRIIRNAHKKIIANKNLKVIGITGSYGKSTTKEFLATILSGKYKVLKTPQNINTEIGIAKFILQTNLSEYDFFIVEMGAYRKGEIKAICDIVKPEYGILTIIGKQHLSLFKTINNIAKTKLELIKSLPKTGIGILNYENKEIIGDIHNFDVKRTFFSVDKHVAYYAKNVIVNTVGKISFTFCYKDKEEEINLNIIGLHNVSNMLSVLALVVELGMSFNEIEKQFKYIHNLDRRMSIMDGYNKSLIINNTYNAGTEAVISSLNNLKNYKGKKIFVFSSMVEMGDSAKEDHFKVGELAGKVCDYIFITSTNFSDSLKSGILKTGYNVNKYFINENYNQVGLEIKKIINENDVILLEGRGPEKIIRIISE